jgi:predicted RNase H-like HicB family nuclease
VTTFRVIVKTEEPDWFVGEVEGGGVAQGKSIAEVTQSAKEVAILMHGLPDDADVDIRVVDGD